MLKTLDFCKVGPRNLAARAVTGIVKSTLMVHFTCRDGTHVEVKKDNEMVNCASCLVY